MTDTPNPTPKFTFSIYAELRDDHKPLFLLNLPFGRLIDEVVVPLQRGDAFFVDGALLTKENIKRLKIVRQKPFFDRAINDLHWKMRSSGDHATKKLYAEQYAIRLEAILRECGDDVTAQIINAYDMKIKPRLKDYLPNREELIKAALELFTHAMKSLGGSH